MTHDEILARFGDILRELADDDDIQVTDATVADDVEAWDSLLQVKLVIALESEFGVRFETSEINAPANVGEFVELIRGKL